MLGGSTHLNKRGSVFEGDLSGIQAARLPFWFQHFYKPGKKIAKNRNWDAKLDEIAATATEWDIGIIVGVPAWIQILTEKVVKYHNVSNIHEVWPNLSSVRAWRCIIGSLQKGIRETAGPAHQLHRDLPGFRGIYCIPNIP